MDRGPDICCQAAMSLVTRITAPEWAPPKWGDRCVDQTEIDEWFERTCHDRLGDHYRDDCDAKCKQLGLGAGQCVTDADYCGGGIDSAHCVCEKGSPVPSPSTTPIVAP